MDSTHSQKVRRILNSKFGFVPALDWNLTHWFPQDENRVQFVIKKKDFHGVICVDVDPKSADVFIVGFADFNLNSIITRILVHQTELIDFIDNLKPILQPHRAPKDDMVPNDARIQDSFFV